ncbi:MAG: hypothetical protein WAW41_16675 [Methylobacter sp.]
MKKSPLAPLLQRGGLRAILRNYWLTFFFQTLSQQRAVSVFSFEKNTDPASPFYKGGLRAILRNYWLIFFFQTLSQQRAVSVFSCEKNRPQEHGSILEKNTDPASPFVKGGLRGIFHCVVLRSVNEGFVA